MPHLRVRFISEQIIKGSKLWPVVGLLGPRQAGKTTVFEKLLNLGEPVSLDDLAHRREAQSAPKVFLSKLSKPTLIDEVQKAPHLFDAIKLIVDKKRIPGSFFLTGSARFSSKLGIRESLTGRIGLYELLPMTVAEIHQFPFKARNNNNVSVRFDTQTMVEAMINGGMPVPAFLRSREEQEAYWTSWLETMIYRDLSRFFKRSFDPELAFDLLYRMADVMREGELPTLKHFTEKSTIVRKYLDAFQDIFLVRKIRCHKKGIGKDVWLFFDSGLARFLMRTTQGEGATLTLIRHCLWNEWAAQNLYTGKRFEKIYYKSAQGTPIDKIEGESAFKVVPSVTAVTSQRKWEERSLISAVEKLNLKNGYLVAPVEKVELPTKQNRIGVLPWSYWS